MKQITNQYSQGGCFFCGATNPVGLRLTFLVREPDTREVICRWEPPLVYAGFGRILHGGIQSGIFDEIMGWTAMHVTGKVGVTSSLDVRFLTPLFVEQQIEARCRVSRIEGSRIHLSAEITDENGVVCTEAEGAYALMDPAQFERLVGEK